MSKRICLSLILIIAFAVPSAYAKESATGTISGRVLGKNGESMSGGRVLIFTADSGPPPARHRYWRTPDDIVEIGSDGGFRANLAEGRYYIAAIKRKSSETIGPPEEGDLIYPYSRKDLKSDNREYAIKKNGNTDIGVIAEAVPFNNESYTLYPGITAIEGKIVDEQGKPVSGAMAFAYPSPDMTGKPLFTSDRTGRDGSYSLRVSEGGRFYIKIRNTSVGGHPVDGEILGEYGKEKPEQVAVKTGEIKKAVNIIGKRFDNLFSDMMSREGGSANHGPNR
jgi:hypothetical protein